jgi:sialate O-acetylesterase
MASAISAVAEIRMPKIFTDNMVVQRDRPVRVWGWAAPGEEVQVALASAKSSTKTNGRGEWSLELPAIKAGDNLELTVTGANTIVLKNLLVGDVWVCSGQSNMEMTLNGCLDAEQDIKSADLPLIRRIKMNHVQSGQPEPDAPTATPWQVCSPETAGGFTAAGFYFAREIVKQTGVPVGIVDVNWGGTAIEPWIAAEGLAMVDKLQPELAGMQAELKGYRTRLPGLLTEMDKWIAQTRRDLANGEDTSPPPAFPAAPVGRWGGMYNAMIHPLVRMPIKGALWYQGESNGGEGDSYYDKMCALIGGWRHQWSQGDFPFYFVQLANFQAVNEDPAGGNGWAKLREAQLKSLTIPNTGMAVIIDTLPLADAGNIHPRNKYDVGLRLARWALGRDYGQSQLEVSGPLFKAAAVEGDKVRLTFDHVGAGLMVGNKEGRQPVIENKEGKLKQFAIAGADKKWFWADAVIDKHTLVVSAPEVTAPVAVRYAYQMNPDGANLYNRDGLPASPFRTDDW